MEPKDVINSAISLARSEEHRLDGEVFTHSPLERFQEVYGRRFEMLSANAEQHLRGARASVPHAYAYDILGKLFLFQKLGSHPVSLNLDEELVCGDMVFQRPILLGATSYHGVFTPSTQAQHYLRTPPDDEPRLLAVEQLGQRHFGHTLSMNSSVWRQSHMMGRFPNALGLSRAVLSDGVFVTQRLGEEELLYLAPGESHFALRSLIGARKDRSPLGLLHSAAWECRDRLGMNSCDPLLSICGFAESLGLNAFRGDDFALVTDREPGVCKTGHILSCLDARNPKTNWFHHLDAKTQAKLVEGAPEFFGTYGSS